MPQARIFHPIKFEDHNIRSFENWELRSGSSFINFSARKNDQVKDFTLSFDKITIAT